MVKRKDRPGYYYRWSEGGRVRWISLGSNYQAACEKLRKVRGQDVPVHDLTVKEAAKQWLASYVETSRNEKGKHLAKVRVQRYLEPGLGHYLVTKLTSEHLRSYRLFIEKQKKSVQTVSHVLSDARCFLRWCEDTGFVQRSPFPRKLLPKVQEQPPDRLKTGEVEQLVSLPEPWGFVIRLALGTGLRWGELCRAQATDVERGFLVVHQTKSGKVRRVPLEAELLSEIRRRVGKLSPYATSSPGTFSRTVRRITGLKEFHVHQLRHEFACSWLEKGRSLAALQQVLGHASIETTQRYARMSDEAVMRELNVGRL